jgi:chromosome segregation ATPase
MLEQTIERGFERVWQTFQETDKKFRETDLIIQNLALQLKETDKKVEETSRQLKETDKKVERYFEETSRKFQETERQLKETDKKVEMYFAETSRQLQETDKKVERYFEETSRKFQETERQLQETDKKVEGYFEKTSRQLRKTDQKFDKYFGKIKELDRNWGKLVEAMVEPSAAKLFQERGIAVVGSEQRKKRQIGGETTEIDILLVNDNTVIAVEVKTTLSIEDVNDHINKHLKPFKSFFPEHKDKKVYGAVAYIHVEESADRYAYKKGLFVMAFAANEMVIIKNDTKFIPKIWEEEE